MELKDIKAVYFVGAGGIGMSAIARYFISKGQVVAGYDKTPSDLKITLTKDANVNLKDVKFDGIKFKATAVSKDATTLNKDNHYININDLKISVNSEVSIDADKKKDDKK